MRSGAVILNSGRGGLIDEAALHSALLERKIDAAYLDVLCQEPPQASNPHLKNPFCKITPHIAWATLAARKHLIAASVHNLKYFLSGNVINNVAE